MKIGIIGAGNIGGAIAEGLARSLAVKSGDLLVSDVSEIALENLKKKSEKISVTVDNQELVKKSDVVFLAVKPWLVQEVLEGVKNAFDFKKQLLVSVAAGVDLEKLYEILGNENSILRMIPNTAVAVNQGVSVLSCGKNVEKENVEKVKKLLAELGEVFVVEQTQLNAFMSLSSCGIAYAFRYIRAAVEGAVEMGIPSYVAQNVVAQTVMGAAELLKANSSHPEVEIDKVTTPGGITIKGLNEMEKNGFTSAVIQGLKASLIK